MINIFFKQLKYLSTLEDDILLLEDDIKLRPNFFSVLNDLIKLSQNNYIINMSQPTDRVYILKPQNFIWTRAVYYPKGSIAKFIKKYSKESLKISEYYDKIQATLMEEEYIGCASVMTIIDLNLKSLMDYSKKIKS